MDPRTVKRRRTANTSAGLDPCPTFTAALGGLNSASTEELRGGWAGWSEVESEPALFNVMLRQFGVRDVRVEEIVSLDDEMLRTVSKPIYGLVFLFRWRQRDQQRGISLASNEIWFANQTVSNACATVALLNIVNNCAPEVQLGEHLSEFKSFTQSLSPALRGDAIGNHAFLRRIHNSFARKMDMLNADLFLKNQAQERRGRCGQDQDYESESAFHFIAFVPVHGRLWRLDGLEREPEDLGMTDEDDWVRHARPALEAQMARCEEGRLEFAILGLVRDPACNLRRALAENIRVIQALSASGVNGAEMALSRGVILGPCPRFGVDQSHLDSIVLPLDQEARQPADLDEASLDLRMEALKEDQDGLKLSIIEAQESHRLDEESADWRRYDFGPLLARWTRLHVRKGILQSLLVPG